MKIFLDTSMLIALFLTSEEFHEEVLQKYTLYERQKAILITSNYILDELFTWINSRYNRFFLEKIFTMLEKIQKSGNLKIMYIDRVVDKKAKEVLLKFSDHNISFTDATTYVLYKDFNLDEVFTLDSDFKKMRIRTSF